MINYISSIMINYIMINYKLVPALRLKEARQKVAEALAL